MQRLPEKQDDLHPVMESLNNASLGKVIRKAKWLLALDHLLKTLLPAEFVASCHVMNVNQGALIVGVSSAAVATRLRFHSADLLLSIQRNTEFARIQSIQWKIVARNVVY